MNTIYLITGPAGVGKSTISKGIADKLEKSVIIEGDDIYHLVASSYVSPWLDGNHLDYFWDNCLSLIDNSLKYSYDVVFNYIMDDKNVDIIKHKFPNAIIKFVCLMVDDKTLLNRDKERPEDCRMGERCIILLESFKNKNILDKYRLDTSNLSVDDTIKFIMNSNDFVY